MRKIYIIIPFLIISAILTSGVLPNTGIDGLIGGITIKNPPALVLSEFIIISLLLFNNMGKCEDHINGYAKYKLLRHKKRQILLNGIYRQTLLFICFLVLSRIIIFIVVLIVKGEIIAFDFKDTVNYILLLILVLSFISLVQFYFEIKYSSPIGLVCAMTYYIFSVLIGGILAKKGRYKPILLLIPNYYMKKRYELLVYEFIKSKWILYIIPILLIITLMLLSGKTIQKKDIF